MIAEKATKMDHKIKILVWGEPGSGKSRFSLSSPKPLVIDLENSTTLYGNEFDFYRATIDQSEKSKTDNACKLTSEIIKEIANGVYKNEVETLVIDPVSDLMDNLEAIIVSTYETKINKSILSLDQLSKTKWYAYRKTQTRKLLDKIIALDVNIVFIARSKLVWGNTSDGMKPIGVTYDCPEILEYLTDIVIKVTTGKNEVTKSRVGTIKTGETDKNTWNELIANKETKISQTAKK